MAAHRDRNLTEGSVRKNLWTLSWPQMVEGALNSLDQTADLFWVGHAVGFRAIGGLGVAQSYSRLIMTGRMGLDMGMQAMISRAVGAGRIDLANHVALQGFTLTAIFAIILVFIGLFLADSLLHIVGVSDAVVAEVSLYLRIQFVGAAAMNFRMSTGSALQASGDSMTPMKATMLSRVVHLVLSPFLIFGWLGVPEMGIAGAAVASVVAHSLGMIWNLYALFTGSSRLHLTLQGYRLDFPLMLRMVKIGGPASVAMMERVFAQLILIRLVTPFGDTALAAFTITRHLEHFTSLGSMGLGRASGVLVGQNLGAGRPERAKSTVRWAAAYVTAIRGVVAIFLFAFPAVFIAVFNNDPEFVEVGAIWLRIQAIGGLAMGTSMVYQQSFSVAGDTMAPMVVNLVVEWILEIPAAYALSQWTVLGQYGIAIATAGAMTVRFLLYAIYFVHGRWLRVKVL